METCSSASTHRTASELDTIIPQVLDTVEALGGREGWADDLVYKVSLILDEVTTNIVSYAGNPPGTTPAIEIAIKPGQGRDRHPGGRRRTRIRPDHPGPPGTGSPGTSPGEAPVGGLGLHLVRNLTNRMSYWRKCGKNHLELHTDYALMAG